MAKLFDYKIQADGRAYREVLLGSADIHNTWAVVHKNPDEKGRWVLDSGTGYLRVDSNQNGLTARFNPANLNAKDYRIETEVIPSSTDDDTWGTMFRYQDIFHFYFVAWDGGGEYGWGADTLRLYKVEGDVYKLLASAQIGPWTGGQVHSLNTDIIGNRFIVKVNGVEHINVVDNDKPYLEGAYGPCATSQIASWKRFFVRGEFDFMLEKTFPGEVETTNFDQATSKRLNVENVKDLMTPTVMDYLTVNGFTIATARINTYTLQSLYDGAEVFFNTNPVTHATSDGGLHPYGYMKYSDTPPKAPTNFRGKADGTTIAWSWDDNAIFEEGYEILDEQMQLLAVVSRNATSWEEGGLEQDKEYRRYVRSYNASGRSAPAGATARTEDLSVFLTPNSPTNLRGMTNGLEKITWYWDAVKDADFYQLWDAADDTLIITINGQKFPEIGLTPDTMYGRYITATNIAGRSSKSNVAVAFTEAIPVIGLTPESPLNFAANVVDENTIRWFWDAPTITLDPNNEDGTPKEQAELDAELEIELSKIAYRVYDMNGEVLYEAPANVLEFTEINLLPNVSYTHYVKAFNTHGEGPRSNYAYATTFAEQPEDQEEPPVVLPWPPEDVKCILPEEEPHDKMDAFHTAIGDNLDLKVRPHGAPPEYLVGNMNRTLPADIDGDGEPDYKPGEGPGEESDGSSGSGNGGAGLPGEEGAYVEGGFGPGNIEGGGHGSIGGGGLGIIGGGIGGGIGGIGSGGSSGGTGGSTGGIGGIGNGGLPGYLEGDGTHEICGPNSPREWFTYDVQLQATEYLEIDVYLKKCFQFRYRAEGIEKSKGYLNDYIGRLFIFPEKPIDFRVSGEINKPEPFTYKVIGKGRVRSINQSLIQYSARSYADISFSNNIPMTIQDIFHGPDAERWGPNTWTLDAPTNTVIGDHNTGWSGFYNTALLNDTDYMVETKMAILDDGDDDFFGFAFRLQENANNTKRFYYFGVDNGGTGLGSKWGLYKTVGTTSVPSSLPGAVGFGALLKAADMSGLPYSTGWVKRQWYKVRIMVKGSRIQVWLDDVQVIDIIDNDPFFDRGSWGPTNLSQEGASYKDIVYVKGDITRVYGNTYYDSIDKSHNSPTLPKTITTDPLQDELRLPILNAYNAWKTMTGNNVTAYQVIGYGAEVSHDQIRDATSVLGEAGIKVYTAFPPEVLYDYTDVSFESASMFHSITDVYNAANKTKQVAVYNTIGYTDKPGEKAIRVLSMLLNQVLKFKHDNNISADDLDILEYEVVSLSPKVNVSLTQRLSVAGDMVLDIRVFAWTTAKTIYKGSKDYQKAIRYDETMLVNGELRDISARMGAYYYDTAINVVTDIVLQNEAGETYVRETEAEIVAYKIEEITGTLPSEVSFVSIPVGTTGTGVMATAGIKAGKTPTDNTILVPSWRSTEYKTFDFIGTTTGPVQDYFHVEDLNFTNPVGAKILSTDYPNAHMAVQVHGGTKGPWMAFANDEYKRVTIDHDRKFYATTVDRHDLLVVGTEGDSQDKPWMDYSVWYDACVNGEAPFYQDGDGLKDFLAPIDMDAPANIEITKWHVELNDPTGDVSLEILNGTGTSTVYPNDTVRFYSNVLGKKLIGRKWFGPIYTVEGYREICGGGYIEFTTKVLSPEGDVVLDPLRPLPPYRPELGKPDGNDIVIGHFSVNEETGESSDITFTSQAARANNHSVEWEAIIISKNPNVAIKVESQPDYSNEPGIFLPLKVRAWIINPIQTPWNPFIHNGFYYMNQREHFLYASQNVRGRYTKSEGFQPVEFPYTVKLYAERVITEGIKTVIDTYRSDFRGINSLVDLDSSLGNIQLRKDGAGRYYSKGTYTSETKKLNEIPAAWKEVNWDATTPVNSTIGVEVSSAVAGVWGPWTTVQKGDIIPVTLSDTFRYRVTLNEGQERIITMTPKTYDTDADWATGVHDKSLHQSGQLFIEQLDTNAQATWVSPIVDLGVRLEELGNITYKPLLGTSANASVILYTMTADNVNGPWEAYTPLANVVANTDGTKTGKIVSGKKRYLIYKVELNRGQSTKVLTTTLNGASLLGEGLTPPDTTLIQPVNVTLEGDRIVLDDISQDGIYYSAPIDLGKVINLKKVVLNTVTPVGTSVAIKTITASTLQELELNEVDPLNWSSLAVNGDILSVDNRFIKVAVEMKSANEAPITKTITHDSTSDFVASEVSNVKIANGQLQLDNTKFLGYYVSESLEFKDIDSWIDVTTLTSLNGGNIVIYTATSPNQFGPWTPWEILGASNRIQSPTDAFIRYKLELSGTFTPTVGTYTAASDPNFQTGSVTQNISFLPNASLSQVDPSVEAIFESPVLLIDDLTSYADMRMQVAYIVSSDVYVTTQTSYDGITWGEWKPLDSSGRIQSDKFPYFKYRVEIRPRHSLTASLQTLTHDTTADFESLEPTKANVKVVGNSVLVDVLVDPITKAVQTGNYYSGVLDFKGKVTGLAEITLNVAMPTLGGAIKLYTVSGDDSLLLSDNQNMPAESVPWIEATFNAATSKYTIKSPVGRFIRYRVEVTPGYGVAEQKRVSYNTEATWNTGAMTNIIANSSGQLLLVDPAIDGEYISKVIDFSQGYDKLDNYENVRFDVSKVEVGGSAELFMKTAETEAGLTTAAEVSLGINSDGSLTSPIGSSGTKRFIQFRIVLKGGTASSLPASPRLSVVELTGVVRKAVSPSVDKIMIPTTALGFQGYEVATVSGIGFNYEQNIFTSPIIERVNVSARTFRRVGPELRSITVTADVFDWFSPTLDRAVLQPKVYNEVSRTPVLHEITLKAEMPSVIRPEEFEAPMTGKIEANMQVHQLSEKTLTTIMDEYFTGYTVSQSNLTRVRYELIPGIPGIEMDVRDSDVSLYVSGDSAPYARSLTESVEALYSQAKVLVDEKNQALVTPAPQQGAPVIVKDASGIELTHVSFMDDEDNLTLWYKDCGCSDGLREFVLPHEDLDPATLEIEVDAEVPGVYTKLTEGIDYLLCGTVVTFKEVYPEHVEIWYKYKIKHSFILDHNYDVKKGNALITLHNPTLDAAKEITVTYETDFSTAYYKATEVDMNPMRNVLNEGFIYLTDDYFPAKKLEVRFNPNMLNANGKDRTTIRVFARDKDGNPVVGDKVTIKVSDGTIVMNNKETDFNGMVSAMYTASTVAGKVIVTVEDKTARLEASSLIHLRSEKPQPRIEVELSDTELTPDGIEKVKITARVVDADQQQSISKVVYFEAIGGGVLDFTEDSTNVSGEAHNYIKTTTVPKNKIIVVKAHIPEFDVVGFANILVKEVAPIV